MGGRSHFGASCRRARKKVSTGSFSLEANEMIFQAQHTLTALLSQDSQSKLVYYYIHGKEGSIGNSWYIGYFGCEFKPEAQLK